MARDGAGNLEVLNHFRRRKGLECLTRGKWDLDIETRNFEEVST